MNRIKSGVILRRVGIPIGVGFGIYYGIQRKFENINAQKSLASPWEIYGYKALPLRFFSRIWGSINNLHLPESSRNLILGTYAKKFECNLDECESNNLKDYPNLATFFKRKLRDDVRPISEKSQLVSPCDGKILHFGIVDMGDKSLEQVKGLKYSLRSFLGPLTTENPSLVEKIPQHAPKQYTKSQLYQCVIYLGPGDYHHFHSPTNWNVKLRRHFQGYLLSVNPTIANWIGDLFVLNERVIYIGDWIHGFFSMSAIGATNVGSININFDAELTTNCNVSWNPNTFCEKKFEVDPITCQKGQEFGEFNLGSTIVLIFEAPLDFEFGVSVGDRIKMGESLSTIEDRNVN